MICIALCLEQMREALLILENPALILLQCQVQSVIAWRAEGNENQEKTNAVIKSIVNSYGIKTLDFYHESGIVPDTKISNIGYLSDGLHLAENGYTALGNLLAAEIKYLLCI